MPSHPTFNPNLPPRVQPTRKQIAPLTGPSVPQVADPVFDGAANVFRSILQGAGQVGEAVQQERDSQRALDLARTETEKDAIRSSMVQLQKNHALKNASYQLQMPDHLSAISAEVQVRRARGEEVDEAQIIEEKFSDSFEYRTSLKSEIARQAADGDAALARESFVKDPSKTLGDHFQDIKGKSAGQYGDVIMRNAYLGEMLKHEGLVVKKMQDLQLEDAEKSLTSRVDEELDSSLRNGFVGFFSAPDLRQEADASYIIDDAMASWSQTKYGKPPEKLSDAQRRDMQETVVRKAVQVLGSPNLNMTLQQRQQVAASFENLDIPASLAAGLPAALDQMDKVVLEQQNSQIRDQVTQVSGAMDLVNDPESFAAIASTLNNTLFNTESPGYRSVRIGTDMHGAPAYGNLSPVQMSGLQNKYAELSKKYERAGQVIAMDITGGNAGITDADEPILNDIFAKWIRPVNAGGAGLPRPEAMKRVLETYGRNAITKQMMQEINTLPFSQAGAVLDSLVKADPNLLYYDKLQKGLSPELLTIYDNARLTRRSMAQLQSELSTNGITDENFSEAIKSPEIKAGKVTFDQPGWIRRTFGASEAPNRVGPEAKKLLVSSYVIQRARGLGHDEALDQARLVYKDNSVRVNIGGRVEDIIPLPINNADVPGQSGNVNTQVFSVSRPSDYQAISFILDNEFYRRKLGGQARYDLQNMRMSSDKASFLVDILIADPAAPGLELRGRYAPTAIPTDPKKFFDLVNNVKQRNQFGIRPSVGSYGESPQLPPIVPNPYVAGTKLYKQHEAAQQAESEKKAIGPPPLSPEEMAKPVFPYVAGFRN